MSAARYRDFKDWSEEDRLNEPTSEEDPKGFEKTDKNESVYIYIIREKESDYYKVGRTNDLKRRFRNLKAGNPRQLIMKRHMEVNNPDCERMVHKILQPYRVNMGGGTEWFRIDQTQKHVLDEAMAEIRPYCVSESVSEEDT